MLDILNYLHKPFPSELGFNLDIFTIKDIKRYLDNGGDIHNKSEDGLFDALLFSSILKGKLKKAKFLLENGADEFIDKPIEPGYGMEGIWPLYAAVEESNYDMVKLLLKYGANPNIKEGYLLYVLELEIYSRDKKPLDNRDIAKSILKLLLRNGFKITEKNFPIDGCEELIEFLSDMGIKKPETDILDTLLYT